MDQLEGKIMKNIVKSTILLYYFRTSFNFIFSVKYLKQLTLIKQLYNTIIITIIIYI